MKTFIICMISICCMLGLMATGTSAADTVKVGIVLPLTGPQTKFGQIEKKSFDLALKEVNNGYS